MGPLFVDERQSTKVGSISPGAIRVHVIELLPYNVYGHEGLWRNVSQNQGASLIMWNPSGSFGRALLLRSVGSGRPTFLHAGSFTHQLWVSWK